MTVMSSNDREYRRSPKTSLFPHKHDDYTPLEVGFIGASFSSAVFNLSTTIVGVRIMALSSTLKQLGLILGVVIILMGVALTETSIDDMILRFGRDSKTSTYSGVVADAFGGFWRTLLQICIVINNLGMLIVYMIIIGMDFLLANLGVRHSSVMEEWFDQHWWTARCSLLLLLTTVFVFAPLISFKRVDSLRYTSTLSVGLATVFVVITAGVVKLFTIVPIIVTTYICHHNVRTSLTLCSSVYIATSFFGVLFFCDKTMNDVLANFDGDLGVPYSSLIDDVVRLSYGVQLMLVFPIVFFSLRLNLDELLFPYAILIAYDNRRFFSVTVALMGFIFQGANFVPNIWDAFQLTGETATIVIGFIFPSAITLSQSGDTKKIQTLFKKLLKT
ncbi:sodium-coupled neutral amino acid transporter [Salix suchowensis]|nr:sodium-coupled neutral amino acid transporter [Salix suchowensis]